ncbi:MAG: histidine kinase [Butyrivibrio sp.]|nr:histidine kinase [Butyrivibrio sp.]
MSKEVRSFQENIRRTFIRYSVVPVAVIVVLAMVIFVFAWSYFVAHFNEVDNHEVEQEISRDMNIYYDMVDTVERRYLETDSVVMDKIFDVLYSKTDEFGEIGNLILLSPDQKILFTSKGSVPKYLTQTVYSNWGVWNAIRRNPGEISTTLYESNLYVAKGIYDGDTLKCAIVYMVPEKIITDSIIGSSRYVYITDVNGWVFASNTWVLNDEYGQIQDDYSLRSGYMKVGNHFYYSYKTETGKGLNVITVNDLTRSIWLIIVLIGIIVVIFAAIIFIAYRSSSNSSVRYTRDIKKIEDAFEAVQNGDFDVKLNINSSREFMTIGNDFNEMLSGLKEQINQNRELAENVAFSQVKQLESQFNPHFLFNTLDNIRFMAKIDSGAADKMIVSLSGLLRYSIRDSREEVTVREDLSNVQDYLNILQIRFNKRFAYNIDVAEDIMDCLIPKLLIQPLLENAVKYGFAGQEKLTVDIKGYQIKEDIVFICKDDGAGIEKDRLEEILHNLRSDADSSQHFGIYNIHRRIRLMYKGEYGLDISSVKDEGTTVRIVIPRHYA